MTLIPGRMYFNTGDLTARTDYATNIWWAVEEGTPLMFLGKVKDTDGLIFNHFLAPTQTVYIVANASLFQELTENPSAPLLG